MNQYHVFLLLLLILWLTRFWVLISCVLKDCWSTHQVPQPKTACPISQAHDVQVHNISSPALTHTCIPVTCRERYEIPPHSSLPILVNIHYPGDKTISPDKLIVVSSECLQVLDDWTSLSVFFHLIQSRATGTIIYTNTTDENVSLFPVSVVACAEVCYYPEQIDAKFFKS